MSRAATCHHPSFSAVVEVHRLQDEPGSEVDAFMAVVRIACSVCGQQFQFQFLGLDRGLDIGGARCGFDRTEAHLTISPDGLPPTPTVRGFSIRATGGGS